MNAQQLKFLSLAALCLPFLVLGGIASKETLNTISGEVWRVKITGYDPRELFYGRYMRYQINWSDYTDKKYLIDLSQNSKQSLCLIEKSNSQHPRITDAGVKSQDATQCRSVLIAGEGDKYWNKRQRKYFIPEQYANALDWAFARTNKYNFEIDIRAHDNGQLSIGSLYINGQPMREAMPALTEAYRKDQKEHDTPATASTWRIKMKNVKPVYVSDNQNCMSYELDWGYHGYNTPISVDENTPSLCFTEKETHDTLPSIPSVSLKTTETEDQCESIADPFGWGSDNWNTNHHTFCRSRERGKFMLNLVVTQNDNFWASVKVHNNGTLHTQNVFIGEEFLHKLYSRRNQ